MAVRDASGRLDLQEVSDMVRRMAVRVVSGVVLATAVVSMALGAVNPSAAVAAAGASTPHGIISGQLGFEGGAYPGGFHPTGGRSSSSAPRRWGLSRFPSRGTSPWESFPATTR